MFASEEKFAIVVCIPTLPGIDREVTPVAILTTSNDVPRVDMDVLVREEYGESATWWRVPVRRIVLTGWRIA